MSVLAWLTSDPIDPGQVLGRVGGPSDGAALLFVGTVRDHNDDRPVSGVSYSAYEGMAQNVLRAIAGEAAERLGSERIAVVHRVGELGIEEASVAIAASSPHRAESFDAVRYVIEEIKKRLPVWKREHYVEGESRWLEGSTPNAEVAGE